MVTRLIKALKKKTTAHSFNRMLILVTCHPEKGYVYLTNDTREDALILNFNAKIIPSVRALLKPIFPYVSPSDLHAYREFSSHGVRYQLVAVDWPVATDIMYDQVGKLELGWKFLPLQEHPQLPKILKRANFALSKTLAVAA